jgi:hypothetical protein
MKKLFFWLIRLAIKGLKPSHAMLTLEQLTKVTNGFRISPVVESLWTSNESDPFKNHIEANHASVCYSSDYGGEHPGAKHYVYSFYFTTFEGLQKLIIETNSLRQLKNYSKAPQVKTQKDTSRKGKLADFLQAALKASGGFVVSLAVPKGMESLFAASNSDLLAVLNKSQLGPCPHSEWNVERAARVTAIPALVLGFILNDTDKVFWMSPKDSIVNKQDARDYTMKMLQSYSNLFGRDKKSIFMGYSLPWSDDKKSIDFSDDFLFLNDLISGAFGHYLDTVGNKLPEEVLLAMKPKHVEILKACNVFPNYLYRLREEDGKVICARYQLQVVEESDLTNEPE